MGIIEEVVGEMVKADSHTHKEVLLHKHTLMIPYTENTLTLRMRPLPCNLDLSSPQSTKDSFVPNNTDISSGYPILFLFLACIFKPYILCVHPLELKGTHYFNSDIIKNSSCPIKSPYWSYSED